MRAMGDDFLAEVERRGGPSREKESASAIVGCLPVILHLFFPAVVRCLATEVTKPEKKCLPFCQQVG